MHPALYTRASMIREIAAAVGFISKFLRTKGLMNERQLQTFSQSLQELLAGEGGAGAAGAAPRLRPREPRCPLRRWAACLHRRRLRAAPPAAPRPAGGRRRGRGRTAPPRGWSYSGGRCGGRVGLLRAEAAPGGWGRQERAVNKRGSGVAQAAKTKLSEQPGLGLCSKGSDRPVSSRKDALKLPFFFFLSSEIR